MIYNFGEEKNTITSQNMEENSVHTLVKNLKEN